MKKLSDIINSESGKSFMIIGTGSSMGEYRDKIVGFVRHNNIVTIGINNMQDIMIPNYNIWTNNGRLLKYGSCIDTQSILLFGSGIKKQNRLKWHQGKYIIVDFIDKQGIPIGYVKGQIRGFYRTAGCLSIVIAHLMGAKNIYIAGMDGYTLNSQEHLNKKIKGQHFYGKGMTDGTEWEYGAYKDKLVYDVLRNIDKYGIKFQIVTPTVFKEFYHGFTGCK